MAAASLPLRRCVHRHHLAVYLLALLVPSFAAPAALNATSYASDCASKNELFVGASSCSPACGVNYSGACITFSAGSSPCDVSTTNALAVTPSSCPLPVSDGCGFQCLDWTDATSDSFTFFVVPSTWASSASIPQGAQQQRERFVSSVGSLVMPERVKYVSIIGGSSFDNVTASSSTVSVRVALELSGASVTNLTLANLNMAPTGVPSIEINQSTPSLQSLRIVNSQLTTLPMDNSDLAALTTLDLSSNRIVSFPAERSLESLIHLSLRNNSLTSFQAMFPALQTLDLSMNALTELPDSVILFTKLRSLNISGNLFRSAQLRPAQYNFLSNLSSFTFDPFPTTDCTEANQKLLRTTVVCVVESTEVLIVKKSSLAWYIGVPVIGTAALTLGGFSLWYYRRKKKTAKLVAAANAASMGAMATKTESTGEAHTHGDDDADHIADYIRLGGSRSPGSSSDSVAAELIQKRKSTAATPNAPGSNSLWTDEELLACQLRYEDIDDIKQIGSGAYGVVWLVNYRETRLLASKRLIKDQITRQKTQAFVAEIKLNIQLTHPSIVQFVGAAWTVETDLQALFEYMANGDLRAYLDARRYDAKPEISPVSAGGWSREKLHIAIDIVEALVYVHSFTPPLVHRDLKSRNVLLGEDMKAKLSDFGVSRFQSENDTMTGGVGTGRWLAPEVLAGEGDYDHMSDIYSYGVVLSELDTHTLPYEELQRADVAILQMVVAGAVRPHFRDDCPPAIRDLAVNCMAFDSRERPSAMEIAFQLRTLAKEDRRNAETTVE